jgi:hypothetical protein
MGNSILDRYQERVVAEQATGCMGAGDYRAYAEEQGYEFLEVLNWTSSAGDWSFMVSKDEHEWFVMYQENNWPRRGFTRVIEDGEEDQCFCGSAADVLESICNMWG